MAEYGMNRAIAPLWRDRILSQEFDRRMVEQNAGRLVCFSERVMRRSKA
jgi:hypothetical protein